MKTLTYTIIIALFLIFIPVQMSSQQDELIGQCSKYFNSPYITTGQAMKAFLTGEEVAEFHTSLYSGNVYRIATCSHNDGKILFSVYDKNRKLLFDSQEYPDLAYWDFKVEGSLECIIEARLNNMKQNSGVVLVMIGFKSSLN